MFGILDRRSVISFADIGLSGGSAVMDYVSRRIWFASLVLFIAWANPVAADDQPAAPTSCVRTQSIDDWRPLDKWAIVVRTSPSKSFKVTFSSPCHHLRWSVLARVDTRPTTATACLSRGDVILFGRGPRRDDDSFEQEERCTVKSVEPFGEPAPPPASPSN